MSAACSTDSGTTRSPVRAEVRQPDRVGRDPRRRRLRRGYDASALPLGKEYLGVGILYGQSDETPIVRTFLATGEDAQTILKAARRIVRRPDVDRPGGGEDVTREYRDVLRDVHGVFYAGEAWVSWTQIAARLAEQLPEHYADVTGEAISAQLRALQVESKNGRDKSDDNRVVKGAM